MPESRKISKLDPGLRRGENLFRVSLIFNQAGHERFLTRDRATFRKTPFLPAPTQMNTHSRPNHVRHSYQEIQRHRELQETRTSRPA
jgi:hypothetical protein